MGPQKAVEPSLEIQAPGRIGCRVEVDICVEIAGESGPFRAQTVDISRTGVLLVIDDESFLPASEAENMILYSERVEEEFGAGFEVRLGTELAFEAEVVRLSRRGESSDGPMHMACRYARPMSEQEWASLGFTDEDSGIDIDRELLESMSREPEAATVRPGGARQRERCQAVEIHSDYAAYRARTINLSADGVLLEMTDPAFFAGQHGSDRLQICTHRLEAQFGGGLRVRFREAGLSIEAVVVHVGEKKLESGVTVVVGCRFRNPLSGEACEQLGIEPVDGPDGSPVQTRVRELLRLACAAGATDLHLKADAPPRVRVGGVLSNLQPDPIDAVMTDAMALDLMPPHVAKRYREEGHVQFVAPVANVGRFRVQALRQLGRASAAIRCLPEHVPGLAELGLGPDAQELAAAEHGLVLLAGHARSGRSTTLASLVDEINRRRACHIVTLESPVEFVHHDMVGYVTQRDLLAEKADAATAVRQAIQFDADVLGVSEIADEATLDAVLEATESGRLVIASVPGTDAATAVGYLLDKAPESRRDVFRSRIERSLHATLSLRLEYEEDGSARIVSRVEQG